MQIIRVQVDMAFYDDTLVLPMRLGYRLYHQIGPDFHGIKAIRIKEGKVRRVKYADPDFTRGLDAKADKAVDAWVRQAQRAFKSAWGGR